MTWLGFSLVYANFINTQPLQGLPQRKRSLNLLFTLS